MIRNKMADIKSGDNILIMTKYDAPTIINIISINEDKTIIRMQSKRFPDGKRREPIPMMYRTLQNYLDWTYWNLIWYIK